MKIAEIPKVKAGTSANVGVMELNELDQERLYLGTRAKDLLGYSGLIADVTGRPRVDQETGKLTECLRTLDIQVLDTATVIEYQIEEIVRRTREVIQERLSDWATGYFHVAEWSKTSLQSYKRPIPEFALNEAVKIKEQLPEVQFYIQHLSDPKADPFLVAKLDEEIFYVCAWDEPKFEGRIVR